MNKHILLLNIRYHVIAALTLLFSYQTQAQLSVTLNVTPPACFGYTNGFIEAQPQGGTTPYSYQWSNNQSGQTTNGVGAGTYSVTLTDATGATVSASATVAAPAIFEAGIQPQGAVCNGNNDTFSAVANGGTPPFNYLWSNGETSQNITNPNPGYYFVTITDANGCHDIGSANIPAPLSASVHIINTICPGLCDASAEVIISGGIAPYSFLWNTGATGQVIFPLPPGTYTATVTDGNGCTVVASGVVTEPPALVLDVDLQNQCNGNGSATASASGGTPPYVFEWSNGTLGQTVSGLTEGIYFVTVTDANGCKKDKQVTISNGVVVVVVEVDSATCVGSNDGSATLGITSGIGPFSILWSNGETGLTADSLGAGTYSVSVTDDAGCTGTASGNIPAEIIFSLTTSATPAGCGGTNNGTAKVTVTSGGIGTISYLWSDPLHQTTQTAIGLAPGTYSVSVINGLGCTATATATVGQASNLTILVQVDNASCEDVANGSAAVVQVSANALPPFSYVWNTGAVDSLITQLLPGSYSLTLTDAQGCTGTAPVTIGADAGVEAGFTFETSGCPGDTIQVQFMDASVFFPNSNPIVSWQWSFSDGQISALQNPLLVFGDSMVEAMLVITGATGCVDTFSQTIENADLFNVQIPESASTCLGDTLELQVDFDPNDSLIFSWTSVSPGVSIFNGNSPNPSVLAIVSGTHILYVSVENAFGCTFQDSVVVTAVNDSTGFDPSLLTYTQCEGLTIDFLNGNAGVFQWYFDYPDTTATSVLANPSFTYADTGTYTVALVSQLECAPDFFFATVHVVSPPMAAFNFSNSPCSDTVAVILTDISVVPGNITGQFWQFSNGDTLQGQSVFLELTESQSFGVTLTVEFETGCSVSVSDSLFFTVFNPSFLEDTIALCPPATSVELNPNGDSTLLYEWSPPDGLDNPNFWNPIATVTQNTTYTVTISDISGSELCQSTQMVTVILPAPFELSLSSDIAVCVEGLSDTLQASANISALNFQWSSQSDFSDTLSTMPDLPVQIGEETTYFVQASDAFGCFASGSVTVGAFPMLAEVPDFQSICKGNTLTVDFPGISPGDTLKWQPGDPTTQPVSDTADFILTIINQFGCSLTDTLTLNTLDISQSIEVVPAEDTILLEESVSISVNGEFSHNCSWSSGEFLDNDASCNPVASPTQTTTFRVEVQDPATGCRTSGESLIRVVNNICGEPIIFVPNAFTPNGDGLNDVLFVRGSNISKVHIFAIYNRWGETVFESHDLRDGWDGTVNGKTAGGDVFVYFLKVECEGGEEYFTKGNVAVLR